MDLSFVIKQLRATGAEVRIPEQPGYDLCVDGKLVEVKAYHRDPTPSDVLRMRNHTVHEQIPLLLMVRRLTPALAELVEREPGLIVVSDHEVVRNCQRTVLSETKGPPSTKRGPRPYARFAVGRALLATGRDATQHRLAACAGVSQGTVSQSLKQWLNTSSDGELFDRLISEYPGPGGMETFWWSDTPVRDQAEDLRNAGALISGDIAASVIRGWRVPERVVGYAKNQVDLATRGYVLANSLDYTLRLIVPIDSTLWATAAAFRRDIADPVITAYDVLRTGTTGDEDQAVRAVREATLNG